MKKLGLSLVAILIGLNLTTPNALAIGRFCKSRMAGIHRARGFQNVTMQNGSLYMAGDRLFGTYYMNEDNMVFNANGYPITEIRGTEMGPNIYYDDSQYKYYPNTGVTIRRGTDWANTGVGLHDSYLYLNGERCTNLGEGFHLKREKILDRDGDVVVEIERLSSGRFHYIVE